MQVTEIAAEGLKREFKVTVAASEIESRVQSRLARLAKTVRMPGFRPGKAPLPLELSPLTWDRDLRPAGVSIDHSIALNDFDRLLESNIGATNGEYFKNSGELRARGVEVLIRKDKSDKADRKSVV